jgi:hypothetical protein
MAYDQAATGLKIVVFIRGWKQPCTPSHSLDHLKVEVIAFVQNLIDAALLCTAKDLLLALAVYPAWRDIERLFRAVLAPEGATREMCALWSAL